jgi:hypothetical protein
MTNKPGQIGVILVMVLLIIAVLIGLLIYNGGLLPKHTPTPTAWWGTAIPSVTRTATVTATSDLPSPIQTIVPSAWLTASAEPSQTAEVTHTATATISPTLTATPIVWTVTPGATYTETYSLWAVIKDCAPKYQWEACYWRCCK